MATVTEAIATAFEHHQNGRFEAAAEICRRVLRVDPKQADAIDLLGLLAQQIGSLEEAVFFFRKAIELRPDFGEAYGHLGNTLKKQGKTDEAVSCYYQAIKLQPDQAIIYANLGNALKAQGKLIEAITCYRRTLELKPDFAPTTKSRRRPQGAGQNRRSSHLLRPGSGAEPGACRGPQQPRGALQDLGKLEWAVDCHRRATELKPDFAEAHNNLGFTPKAPGQTRECDCLLPACDPCQPRLCPGPQQPRRRTH